MLHQDPTNYSETIDQIAESCSNNFYGMYPPIDNRNIIDGELEPAMNYHFSVHNNSGSEICELVDIITENPEPFLSTHAQKHTAEIPESAYYLKQALENDQLAMKPVEQRTDLSKTPNGLLVVPRYLITTREVMERNVIRFLPIQYAIELSHLDVDSKSKAKHIRRLLEVDPALGIMTGIALIKASTYTKSPQFVHEDLFRALGDKLDFFTENNPEHQDSILYLIRDFKNVYNSSEYQDTLEDLYEVFPKIPYSKASNTKGEFKDRFKPLILLSSSEGHLHSYLRLHPEIRLTPKLNDRLAQQGLFAKITSHIISSYLNHEKAEQVLSKCHTQDNWGVLEYLTSPEMGE
jgi:hypothetical protein